MQNHINCFLNVKSLGFYPSTVLDLGAHHGYWSVAMNNYVFPEASYTLVEPIDYAELKPFSSQSRFRVYNILLDETERDVMWYEERNTGDSIYKEKTHHFKNCLPTRKRTTTLDQSFSDCSFDLIKIDCQGAEIPILKGGVKTIQKTAFILLEIPFLGEYNEGVGTFLDHVSYMDSIGYKPFDIVEQHRLTNANNILFQLDILFIKKDHFLCDRVQDLISSP